MSAKEPRRSADMTGWREITCREADLLRRQGAGLTVASTITDPEGVHGESLVFTEWWWCNAAGEEPVLRDYRRDRDHTCSHFIATSPVAAFEYADEPKEPKP